jgi:hypothetical protein
LEGRAREQHQPGTKLVDLDKIARGVKDAHVLLRYAAQSGTDLPVDIVNPLVTAGVEVDAGRVSSETAVAFYTAYAALAARLAPITIETLNVPENKTAKQLKWYGWSAVIVAALVVVFFVITFITNSMSGDIQTSIEHGNDLAVKLRNQVGAPAPGTDEQLCGDATSEPKPPITFNDQQLVISELQDFASTIRGALKTAGKLNFSVIHWETSPLDTADSNSEWHTNGRSLLELNPSLINLRKESICKIHAYQAVRDFAQNVRTDSLVVYGALAAYLLPVLYALLGATAYNLRDFSERVRRRSYHPSSSANTARTIAAITAGAIIGLFNNFSQGIALPPLAIAFLVGYGVEGFFAFLDTLLAAFSNGRRAEAVKPEAMPLPAHGAS